MESASPLTHSPLPAYLEPVHASQGNLSIAKEDNSFPGLVILPLEKTVNACIKRSVDLLLSSILILLIFPWFIPLAALMIKLESRGPVFFRQKRFKKDERIFTCYKLRSMFVNEEADVQAARKNDLRITHLGRILRKTHLDELPQLINVWMVDMSLIGPRPHMISENLDYASRIKYYSLRHQVKPGMTGLAQVMGFTGHITDVGVMANRVEKDIYYIRKWSVLMDVRIMFLTMIRLIKRSN
jgi:putative colanic acid biosysnthesis UDP-glucose lipid carrier transferase